jgi:hypothetical protein
MDSRFHGDDKKGHGDDTLPVISLFQGNDTTLCHSRMYPPCYSRPDRESTAFIKGMDPRFHGDDKKGHGDDRKGHGDDILLVMPSVSEASPPFLSVKEETPRRYRSSG